jgi:spore maturation protein CgeB
MPYENRVGWVDELRKHGVSVIFENSPVFDEYRELANRASVGLNWSSMNDLNARFFETPAFGLAPVMNRVPDAHLFLTEGEDYLGFSNLGEAVEKVLYLKNNPKEIERLSINANEKYKDILTTPVYNKF